MAQFFWLVGIMLLLDGQTFCRKDAKSFSVSFRHMTYNREHLSACYMFEQNDEKGKLTTMTTNNEDDDDDVFFCESDRFRTSKVTIVLGVNLP